MFMEGGETLLAAFRSGAVFHSFADCDSDEFLMLNWQVVGGVLVALFLFFFLIFLSF